MKGMKVLVVGGRFLKWVDCDHIREDVGWWKGRSLIALFHARDMDGLIVDASTCAGERCDRLCVSISSSKLGLPRWMRWAGVVYWGWNERVGAGKIRVYEGSWRVIDDEIGEAVFEPESELRTVSDVFDMAGKGSDLIAKVVTPRGLARSLSAIERFYRRERETDAMGSPFLYLLALVAVGAGLIIFGN